MKLEIISIIRLSKVDEPTTQYLIEKNKAEFIAYYIVREKYCSGIVLLEQSRLLISCRFFGNMKFILTPIEL